MVNEAKAAQDRFELETKRKAKEEKERQDRFELEAKHKAKEEKERHDELMKMEKEERKKERDMFLAQIMANLNTKDNTADTLASREDKKKEDKINEDEKEETPMVTERAATSEKVTPIKPKGLSKEEEIPDSVATCSTGASPFSTLTMTTAARTTTSNTEEVSEMEINQSHMSPEKNKRNNRQNINNIIDSPSTPSTKSPPKKRGKGSSQESEEIKNYESTVQAIEISDDFQYPNPKKTSPIRPKLHRRSSRKNKGQDKNSYAVLDIEETRKKDE